jgi:hypothetical protein
MRLVISIFALCLAVSAPAQARVYYVGTDGADTNAGTTLDAPFRTIAKAASLVEPGDVIEIRQGTYEGLIIRRQGDPGAWITMRPYRHEHVIIDGAGKEEAIYFYRDDKQPVYWIVAGLELRGGNEYVVKIDTPQVKLIKNNLHGSKNDIIKVVSTANDVVIYGNEIHHPDAANGTNAQGVDIVGAARTYVARNYVHDIPSVAMFAKGNATGTIFEDNRVENVYQRGIQLGQATGVQFLDPKRRYESYDGIIRNNVIRNTGGACVATASSFNVRIYGNQCYNVASQFNGAIYVANESLLKQPGTNIYIRNNVIVRSKEGNRPVVQVTHDAMTDDKTLHIDHNIYWSLDGDKGVTFSWERGDDEKRARFPSFYVVSFEQWRKVTGQDRRSLVGDPREVKRDLNAGHETAKHSRRATPANKATQTESEDELRSATEAR